MEVAWHKGPTLMSSAAQYLLFLARVYALFSPLSMDHCIALEMVREIARCEIVPTRNPPPPPVYMKMTAGAATTLLCGTIIALDSSDPRFREVSRGGPCGERGSPSCQGLAPPKKE